MAATHAHSAMPKRVIAPVAPVESDIPASSDRFEYATVTPTASVVPTPVDPRGVQLVDFHPSSDVSRMRVRQETITMAVHPQHQMFAGGEARAAIYYADGCVDSFGIPYSDEHEIFEKVRSLVTNNRQQNEQRVIKLQREIKDTKANGYGTPSHLASLELKLSHLLDGAIYAAQHVKLITDRKDYLMQGRISGINSVRMPDFLTILPFPTVEAVQELNGGAAIEPLLEKIKSVFGEDLRIRRVEAIDAMPFDNQRRRVIPEWVIVG